jgi:hypothetical protein
MKKKALDMMKEATTRRGPIAHAYVPGRDKPTSSRPPKVPPRRAPSVPRSRSGDVVQGTKVPRGDAGPISSAYAPVVPATPRPVIRPKAASGGARVLMSVATRDTDTGGAAWRSSRAYREGRAIERRRANRWLRNTAQGPSRKLYS